MIKEKSIFLALILISVATLGLIVSLGVFIYIENNPSGSFMTDLPEAQITPSLTPHETPYDLPDFEIIPGENILGEDGWITYRNDQLGFEIRYPAGWMVEEDVLGTPGKHPEFQIHKENENPKEASALSFVTILPKGFPTSWPGLSDNYIVSSENRINSKSVSIDTYLTEEQVEYRWFIRFKEYGAEWDEDNFIMAGAEANLIQKCGDLSELTVDPYGPEFEECVWEEGLVLSGEVNSDDVKIIKKIIFSLTFID